MKGTTGIRRIVNAAGYSWAGLQAAYQHESAFRQELFLAILMIPAAFFLAENGIERALLVGSVLLVLLVELLNSAIEAVVDRISSEIHPLAKRAKDVGSAAVLVALLNGVLVWAFILSDRM